MATSSTLAIRGTPLAVKFLGKYTSQPVTIGNKTVLQTVRDGWQTGQVFKDSKSQSYIVRPDGALQKQG